MMIKCQWYICIYIKSNIYTQRKNKKTRENILRGLVYIVKIPMKIIDESFLFFNFLDKKYV